MTNTILLVHGAAHGSWCWSRVAPLLTELGFRVEAIDLPGRAGQGAPGWGVTLESYARAVSDRALALGGGVFAVGHSMGGPVISAAAERMPEAFAGLVYLTAFLPANGESIASLGAEDKDTDLARATQVSMLKGVVTIDPKTCGPVFYGDCSGEDVAWACARLVPESLRPSMTRLPLSADRYGRAPRAYIRCTLDRALSIGQQDRMIARQPCDRVLTLAASHSPFLSMPEQLASAIQAAVRED